MQKLSTLACLLLFCQSLASAQYLKEYVKSFSLRNSDTILIELTIPYEIVDWNKDIVRVFTQVESFSLPKEILKGVSRMGRYRVKSSRQNNLLKIYMPEIHHKIMVKGLTLYDEVIAQIYIPKGFPLQVICSSRTPAEQVEKLWLQQEVLTRRLKYPIRETIDADHYQDVPFEEGEIVAAQPIAGTRRFLQLKVKVGHQQYNLVSRIGKFYKASALLGQSVVFVKHDLKQEIRKLPNEGMVLIKEDILGELSLMKKEDLPDFFFVN